MRAAACDPGAAVAAVAALSHRYGGRAALDRVTLALPAGRLVGLVGPDGVGKSTLLSILAGTRRIQAGRAWVLGGDVAQAHHRAAIRARIAYMPQGLGRNLYAGLTVRENILSFARLFGQGGPEREERVRLLLAGTGLTPFAGREAGKLSGGMKQKLGLCCALVHDPDLLILDEPTTGIDPLSRRQFWRLIGRIRAARPGLSILVATADLREAEGFDWLVAMDGGRVVAGGAPEELRRATGTADLEAAFISLTGGRAASACPAPARSEELAEPIITARGLTCRFGDFTAVDDVSFTIRRGQIFGFVGSNGCGKTTTMRMLTGLTPPSAGDILLFGRPLDPGDRAARRRVGYMSQSFSLYGELSVRQNLVLHARLFHLPRDGMRARVAGLIGSFGLGAHADTRAQDLPLGLRQRLSLAVAIVHGPDLLILDEPTSGVDPLARDRFWALLSDLARGQGVTIFVSTHFMNEAERCDRIALMDAGRVLATDTPAGLVAANGAADLEDAFVAVLEKAAGARGRVPRAEDIALAPGGPPASPPLFSLRRLLACSLRETLELLRDRVRLAFAVLGTSFLMLVFGFGISTDVNSLTVAVLDRDRSHASRAYLEALRGSPYFVERAPLADDADLDRRLAGGEIAAAVEIPPHFGRDVARGRPTEIAARIDGARPFVAQTIRGYLAALHERVLADPLALRLPAQMALPADVAVRFTYNPTFDSIYAMVPAQIALQLALIPAILMALAVVRERELGSIVNLYATPLTRLEFLLGKQVPYAAVAMVNFALMVGLAVAVFRVPLRGSGPTLVLGTLIYVFSTTAYGMLVSTFARTQIAALFGTAILTVLPATMFSGMLVPVSSLAGVARVIGALFPMSYYLPISVGAFTKGLGLSDLYVTLGTLALFVPILTLLAVALLRGQEA
ncbi:ribosome-associated ATPase/putative transporter RbbA [Methylobacterium sp. SyP6R]|uniref:ribosome-associated ATPase/putative transporter RbbA n=1 Tax=Methylobacterium sp. SyP6R TaxID=2718876 RepID=UPI001EFFDB29|nr:ribosome-associated ATPase/putative transporter RbbA [Methylobacterium sp. SyP6R]MCF4129562.1 ribosome-associated ATPase/putative transporter RbbA [Methylobacterium sp. SyP6R]